MNQTASISLIAALGGAAIVGGLILAAVAVFGRPGPSGPDSRLTLRLRRIWNGSDPSAAGRRRHHAVIILAFAAAALAWLLTGLPVIGVLVGIAIPGAPWLFTVGRAEQRSIARVEALGEWTRRLKDVSNIGQGLQQAIVSTAATAPDTISDEVRTLAGRLRAGENPADALLLFADEMGDPVADQVVAALILHLTDRGERLSDVLASIAAGAAADVATRREVEAKRTQPRFAVRFLTVVTLVVLVLGLLNPQYMRPYASPVGQLIMAALGTGFVALLAWVRGMSMPPPVPRFLNPPRTEEAFR
ncbi:Flp pilus assembly protein TadB [Catenuloplanes atrovinosus]|uniref:Flp pilus assembly protein TadB n=2 Tax=Catenuloplanes atrovinosus TaxID=137266 RepID=A0AAE4CC75_9ACTN|nr:type II secretion system F family protein [Catenuloplanes atrovinosus]MDR7278863.1 Flp pilus assembly protein TadB [Catenuloplanes atrovinosus]